MVLVDPCRPLSLFRCCRIRDSARVCTGRGRNEPSPSPRGVQLSALFAEVVQSCRRRCVVRRCSNKRIAIRNHASNRRWRRLVSAGGTRGVYTNVQGGAAGPSAPLLPYSAVFELSADAQKKHTWEPKMAYLLVPREAERPPGRAPGTAHPLPASPPLAAQWLAWRPPSGMHMRQGATRS